MCCSFYVVSSCPKLWLCENGISHFKWNSIFEVGSWVCPSQVIEILSTWIVEVKTTAIYTGKCFSWRATSYSLGSEFLALFACSRKQQGQNNLYKWVEAAFLPPPSFSWTSITVRACWHTGGLSLMSSTITRICRGLSTNSPSLSFVTAKKVYCDKNTEIRCVECPLWQYFTFRCLTMGAFHANGILSHMLVQCFHSV